VRIEGDTGFMTGLLPCVGERYKLRMDTGDVVSVQGSIELVSIATLYPPYRQR
jgi:hypothetical protein